MFTPTLVMSEKERQYRDTGVEDDFYTSPLMPSRAHQNQAHHITLTQMLIVSPMTLRVTILRPMSISHTSPSFTSMSHMVIKLTSLTMMSVRLMLLRMKLTSLSTVSTTQH